jgi:hypothetical protein
MYQARFPRRRRAALVAASFGLGLAALSITAHAGPGDTSCPGSPSQPPFNPPAAPPPPPPGGDVEFDDLLQQLVPQVVEPNTPPLQLLPGKTRVTPGEGLASHLQGPALFTESVPFSFMSNSGQLVSGAIVQKVVNARDCTCDYYWQIHMDDFSALGANGLVIKAFTHPAHELIGNYRNDIVPLGIPSDHVKRSSGNGNTITFDISAIVQPSQVSRQLLLDSSVGMTHKTGTVQVRATDGSLSAPIPAWVPSWP